MRSRLVQSDFDSVDTDAELGVFPDPEHHPAMLEKSSVDSAIAFDIGGELRNPIVAIALRDVLVVRTPVPEAAIDEHSNSPPGKDDVRSHPNQTDPHEVVLAEAMTPAMER